MPSRRQVIASGGLTAAALAGAYRSFDGPVEPSSVATASVEWPMARADGAGSGYNPDASGPTDEAAIRWVEEIDGLRYPSSPILVGDTLFVVGRDRVAALERESGDVRFTRRGSYQSSPAPARASAYRSDTFAVAGEGGIYGLNAAGGYELFGRSIGVERWHAPDRKPNRRISAPPYRPPPVAIGDTIYAIVPETNRVVALEANSGRVDWSHEIGDERSSQPTRPVVSDETVYVASGPTTVVALERASGARRWSVELEYRDDELLYGSVLSATATSEGVLVPRRQAISLLDPADGSVRWEYVHEGSVLADPITGAAAVADGRVFVTDGETALHALDLETGEREWRYEYGLQVNPVVADGVVYLSYDWLDELLAIDAETGDQRWRYEFGFDRTVGYSSPIVGDGVVYVAGPNRVIALEEATEGEDE
ncbi:outer membrane protein assembly factor BamB family protein [Natronolimnobius baerhuensis]|uniref:Pyrrolo-quinoline quinone repeat domain-containing protein n=1 Tax=Natronolimnobius baerhuensis TaxID=253108 RepID=A0A202EAQ8_9EURY|nr:PQQ-binding-like beta-propeller repeat protein [Natronolimnobius baerhuensis]OVE85335.1 hypothetical protein B2G88_00455 [Natronolimnobius baerhuensis]